jgi:hypothetical protein
MCSYCSRSICYIVLPTLIVPPLSYPHLQDAYACPIIYCSPIESCARGIGRRAGLAVKGPGDGALISVNVNFSSAGLVCVVLVRRRLVKQLS